MASAQQTDKSYNIKHGTSVNLVICVLIWVPETAQACLHWRNTCQGTRVEKIRGFGVGVHINHQSLSPTKGETNFLMDLSGNIWNIKKNKNQNHHPKTWIYPL